MSIDVEYSLKDNASLTFHEKALKSGQYFYENDLPGNYRCLTTMQFLTGQHSVHGFVTTL